MKGRSSASPQLTKEANVRFVHTKYMLVDPLGERPVVVTGSANFSEASTNANNENMVVIRQDQRVADIYVGEFMRLYSHYGLPRSGGHIPVAKHRHAVAAQLPRAQRYLAGRLLQGGQPAPSAAAVLCGAVKLRVAEGVRKSATQRQTRRSTIFRPERKLDILPAFSAAPTS